MPPLRPLVFAALMVAGPACAGSDLPALADGDLVFQTAGTGQSLAIRMATGSPLTHVGIVDVTEGGPVVIEAFGPVRETPLAAFRARGEGGRIAVYRPRDLAEEAAGAIVAAARARLGRPYDPFFMPGEETLYCSELVHIAFSEAGTPVGRVQRLDELAIDTPAARALIAARWQRHPACAGLDSAAACVAAISGQTLVTPAAIAADPGLLELFSDF